MSTHVFAIKNCLEHRQTSPLTSTDAQGPKQVPNNLFWCSLCIRKFFRAHKRGALSSKSSIFEQILAKFWFWRAFETMKSQKSSSADVFDFKNCLKCRTMPPINSSCSHGPKLMPNNLFWCSLCLQKFFGRTQTSGGRFQRSMQASNFASQEPKTLQKH